MEVAKCFSINPLEVVKTWFSIFGCFALLFFCYCSYFLFLHNSKCDFRWFHLLVNCCFMFYAIFFFCFSDFCLKYSHRPNYKIRKIFLLWNCYCERDFRQKKFLWHVAIENPMLAIFREIMQPTNWIVCNFFLLGISKMFCTSPHFESYKIAIFPNLFVERWNLRWFQLN